MGKGRQKEDLVYWCQKNEKERSEREGLAKEHLLQVIRDHRPAAELKKQSVAELVALYHQNVGEGDIREITEGVKRAWYSRKSKEREYFPVKLSAKQRKSLKSLYKSGAYEARSMSEVITRLIEEARTIQQQDSELRKSLERYHKRGNELTRMRLGEKQERQMNRLEKQLGKSEEKVGRLEVEVTKLKQLSSDLEAELLELLVQNRLQDIVLAENNVDVSQSYQQIDNNKVNVDMLKEVRARLTALKSKRSKLDSGYYIARADNGSTDGKGSQERTGEDNETPEETNSNSHASKDSSRDESMSNNDDVEQLDEPNPITKEVKEKARESRELDFDGESDEHCDSDSSSEQNSKPNKYQSGVRLMDNHIKWQKRSAKGPAKGDDKE